MKYKCDFCKVEELDDSDMVQSGQFPWEMVHDNEGQLKYTHCCEECLKTNIEAQLAVCCRFLYTGNGL